jgi:hypothetical protein
MSKVRGSRSDAQLVMEAAARRVELREEQEAHGRTLAALREANRMLLKVVLTDRLAHPEDLELYVPLEKLTDASGRILWARVQTVVDELLVGRPNLATPRPRTAAPCPGGGLCSQPTGPVEAFTSGPEHAAQGATRSEPGAGADGSHPKELR